MPLRYNVIRMPCPNNISESAHLCFSCYEDLVNPINGEADLIVPIRMNAFYTRAWHDGTAD